MTSNFIHTTNSTRSVLNDEPVRPIGDKLLVEPIEMPPEGRIQTQEKTQTGRVVSVGTGVWYGKYKDRRRPVACKVGDIIAYEKTRVFPKVGKYLLLQEADIAAILTDETPDETPVENANAAP